MKKRVLSFLLAIGIVLGNCTSGMTVIAEDNVPVDGHETITTDTDERQESETQGANELQGEDDPSEQNDGDSNQQTDVVTVMFNDLFPTESFYYGQEELYWDNNFNVKSEYYTVSIGNESGSELNDLIHITAQVDTQGESYSFSTTDEIVYQETTYKVVFQDSERHITIKEYDPYGEDRDTDRYQSADDAFKGIVGEADNSHGSVFLKVRDNRFKIGAALDGEFNESIAKSSLKDNVYYLRNVDQSEDNKYYLAISKAYTYLFETKASLDEVADFDYLTLQNNSHLDLTKKASNQSVRIVFTGRAVADSASLQISINGEEQETLIEGTIDGTEKDGDKRTIFKFVYDINLEENMIINLDNIGALMIIDNTTVASVDKVQLRDNAGHQDSSFMLDSIPPEVTGFEAKGNKLSIYVSENGSGVDNWYHRVVDFDNDWNNWSQSFEQDHYVIDFWQLNVESGNYNVAVRFVDKAGNEVVKTMKDIKTDKDAPLIDASSIKVFYGTKNEDGTITWDSSAATNIPAYKYGVFSSRPMRIEVKATDNNSISSLQLRSDNNNVINKKDKVVTKTVESTDPDTGDPITSEVQETIEDVYWIDVINGAYKNARIIANDGYSDSEPLYVWQIFEKYYGSLAKEATLTSDLVVEASPALVNITNQPNYSNTTEDEEGAIIYWYGNSVIQDEHGNPRSANISVKIEDNSSGIASVYVKDGASIISSKDYTAENHKTESDQIDISIADFKDGSHTIKIIATDNAGNVNSETQLVFSTDFSLPSGTIDFDSSDNSAQPVICQVNGEDTYWFDGVAGQADTVQFKVIADDGHPAKAEYYIINANNQTLKHDTIPSFDIDSTALFNDSGVEMPGDSEHYYDVKVVIYDEAGNKTELNPLRYYRDCTIPTISKVSVNKTESAGEYVLRILTFGLYSNDDVKITVEVEEPDNDSGLKDNSVEIRFSEDGDPVTNVSKDGKAYSCILTSGELSKLSGEILLKVTDQYGLCSTKTVHYTDTFELIYGTREDPLFTKGLNETASHSFMIDKEKPIITPPSLVSDGVAGADGKVWFKDNHDLIINVKDTDSGLCDIKIYVNGNNEDFKNLNSYHEEPLKQDSGSSSEGGTASKVILSEESTLQISTIEDVYYEDEYILSTDKLFQSYPTNDGHYLITIIAEDYAGNKSDPVFIEYYIDKVAPKVDSIDLTPVSADNYANTDDYPDPQKFVDILEYGFYFHEAFIATVNVSDPEPSSGLHQISYRLQEYNNGTLIREGALQYVNIENGKASFTIPADFKGQIYVNAFDNVGNSPESEVTPHSFVVDTPEHHDSENHIEITGTGDTSYKDGENHPLYDSNVTLAVKITDTMSGIRQITYDLTSEKNESAKKVIDIANTGNAMNQDLGDGWHITALDENLVTEVTKEYTFSSDDNNIQLLFEMTDRSNNSSAKQSDVFSIDQTAPVINVAFANAAGNGEFYRESRTATITVTERNFDPNKIIASIQNSIGGTPTLSFTDNSNTEHVATLTFGEGDYSFSIEGTDLCNHTATVNYSGGNEQSFHVDLKDPLIVDNFTDFINDLENSFNVDKEMTFTITEHNFTANGVNIHVYRVPAGQELTDGNREDCTSEYVTDNMWTSNGDTHNAGFTFSTDYVYQVSITVTDKSGRTPATLTSPVFEIDKTKPVLKTPDNRDKLVYTKKSTQTEADSIVFEDSNIDKIAYSVVAYQMELNEDNVGYDVKVSEPKKFEVNTDSVIISDDYFKNDGIYEVKSVAYDVAGNASDESTHTYVIQRNTDFLVYIPDSNKENQTGLYKFNEKGIRSADFEDIEIISYVTADKSVGVRVGDEDVEGDDIDVKELRGSDLGGDKKNDETINQVTAYDLTLKNSFIAQNYDSDTIDTDLLLNAVASTEDTQQVITLGHIYIDNVKPVGEYEQAIQNLGFFDGFYGVESRAVMIEGVSPDIDLDRCEIQANDLTLKAADGGFVYDENAHTISFTINKGYTDIRPTLVDKAGNINNLPLVKKVYVGGVFARFWYMFIFGGLLVLAIPTLIIMALIKKKKSQPLFK